MTEFERLADQPIETDIHICEGLFVKHAVFAKGSYIPQHSHEFDHLSVIASGAARVWKNGILVGDFSAPSGLVITAHTKHLFLALEDGTSVLCIHRTDLNGGVPVHSEHKIVEA